MFVLECFKKWYKLRIQGCLYCILKTFLCATHLFKITFFFFCLDNSSHFMVSIGCHFSMQIWFVLNIFIVPLFL